MEQLLGAHTSTSGGVASAFDRAAKVNFTAMQIFSKNNNRWNSKELEQTEIDDFKKKRETSKIKFLVVHDSYLINLCASDKDLLKKSRTSRYEL